MIKLDDRLKEKLCDGISAHRKQIEKILQTDKPKEEQSVFLIRDLLKDAFGYKENDLNPQATTYGKRTDITIHYSLGDIICEAKKYNAQKSLLDKDAQDQLYRYCSYEKCEWGILTDGIRWEFYWYPKAQTEGKKFVEANLSPLPGKITKKWCQQFNIFHAKVKNRREYAKARDIILPENVIWWLRHEEVFKALCDVIRKKQNKGRQEINKLIPHIYKCFKEVLPLPEGRNNPYDPMKDKAKRKKCKSTPVPSSIDKMTEEQLML